MNAKTLVAATAAALALIVSVPAQAGWNGAEWGMSLAQVEARYPGLVRHTYKGDETKPWYNTPGPVTYGGATWSDAGFTFRQDRLARVELFTDSPAELIQDRLTREFGPPVTTKAGDAIVQTVFLDKASGNRLTLTDALFFRSLSYEPIDTGS